jgi:hypothetical protein
VAEGAMTAGPRIYENEPEKLPLPCSRCGSPLQWASFPVPLGGKFLYGHCLMCDVYRYAAVGEVAQAMLRLMHEAATRDPSATYGDPG